MTPQHLDLLLNGLAQLGLTPSAERVAALATYHDFLLATHASGLNLTGHDDERESVVKNLLDSLAPWRFVIGPLGGPPVTVGDVGAGGGPTGFALALLTPVAEVVLLESKEKKCRFLRDAIAKVAPVLPPGTLSVFSGDAATFPRKLSRLVFRAFGPLSAIIRIADRILAPGGLAVAYKGRRERIDQELADLRDHQRARCTVEPVSVPLLGDEQRHVVLVRCETKPITVGSEPIQRQPGYHATNAAGKTELPN